MFCMKCGAQLADDAAFCNKCGSQTGSNAAMPASTSPTGSTEAPAAAPVPAPAVAPAALVSMPGSAPATSVPQATPMNVPANGGSPEKKKVNGLVIAVIILAAALVVCLGVFVYTFVFVGADDAVGERGVTYEEDSEYDWLESNIDWDAQEGQAPYKSAEEMQQERDREVDAGMFNISIASVIEFYEGKSWGTAYIENVPGNHYDMQVTITDDETNEVLYESGIIPPDYYIEEIRLNKNLDAGEYECTATFTAFDKQTHEEVGKSAAKVTIEILH